MEYQLRHENKSDLVNVKITFLCGPSKVLSTRSHNGLLLGTTAQHVNNETTDIADPIMCGLYFAKPITLHATCRSPSPAILNSPLISV